MEGHAGGGGGGRWKERQVEGDKCGREGGMLLAKRRHVRGGDR